MDLAAKIKAMLDALTANDPEAIKAAASDLLATLAGGDAPASAPASAPSETLASGAEPPPAQLAALAALRAATGCESLGEAVAVLSAWKSDRDSAAASAAALEESSRTVLVGELVKLGAEVPATAWIGDSASRKICKRLTDEPIADLRARVAALRAAPRTSAQPQAPERAELPGVGGSVVTLSAHEQSVADRIADPIKKAKFIAARAERKGA